jgi:predicted secreted protein
MTVAWRGQGTIIEYALMASGATDADYHHLVEVRISNDQDRSEELDASNHDTPGRFREYVSGMRDLLWNLGGNWLPQVQSHQDFTTMYNAGANYQWRISYPQLTPKMRWLFVGVITTYSHTYDANTLASWTGTLRPAGAPTLVTYT